MSPRRKNMRRRAPARSMDGAASTAFEEFSLEWLRAVARGGDARQASNALMSFVELAQTSHTPWRGAIEAAAGLLRRRCAVCAAASPLDAAMFDMAQAALNLLIEALAVDPFAQARRATRSLDLHAAARNFIGACEDQARSEGWSYLDLLVRSARSAIDQPQERNSP